MPIEHGVQRAAQLTDLVEDRAIALHDDVVTHRQPTHHVVQRSPPLQHRQREQPGHQEPGVGHDRDRTLGAGGHQPRQRPFVAHADVRAAGQRATDASGGLAGEVAGNAHAVPQGGAARLELGPDPFDEPASWSALDRLLRVGAVLGSQEVVSVMDQFAAPDDECVELVGQFRAPLRRRPPQRFGHHAAIHDGGVLPPEGGEATELGQRQTRTELALGEPGQQLVAVAGNIEGAGKADDAGRRGWPVHAHRVADPCSRRHLRTERPHITVGDLSVGGYDLGRT